MKNKNKCYLLKFINVLLLLVGWINFFIFASKYSTLGNNNDGIISSYILICFPIVLLFFDIAMLLLSNFLIKRKNELDSFNILFGSVFFNLILISFMDYLFLRYSYVIQLNIFLFISYILIILFYVLSLLCLYAASGKILGVRLKILKDNKPLSKKVNFTVSVALLLMNTISLLVSFYVAGWLSLIISFLIGFLTIYITILACLRNNV